MNQDRSRVGIPRWSWTVASVLFSCTIAPPLAADSVRVHGYLTSTLRPDSDAIALNENNRGDTPFDLVEVDLFLDAAPDPRLQARAWIVYNDAYPKAFSLSAAYLLYEAWDRGRLYFETGKIPAPLGNYLDRYSQGSGPLIGVPLMWYSHSSLAIDRLPESADDLLSGRGTGQVGPPEYASGGSQRRGAALLYAPCYDIGIVALGSHGSVEYRFGVLTGTPGLPPGSRDNNESRTLGGRLGWSPGAALRLGLSAAWGAYLPESVEPQLPAGKEIADFAQTVLVGDLEASHGHSAVFAEVAWGRFQSPHVPDDLDQLSYYVEVQQGLAPGWKAGARWDEIRYAHIKDGAGRDVRWSDSRRRLELGTSYDVSRHLALRAAYQLNHEGVGGFDPAANLVALQFIGQF